MKKFLQFETPFLHCSLVHPRIQACSSQITKKPWKAILQSPKTPKKKKKLLQICPHDLSQNHAKYVQGQFKPNIYSGSTNSTSTGLK